MQQITAAARTVREVLLNRRYGIDYFQREYRWGERQVEELLKDLTEAFLENYEPGHERQQVAGYGRYFLGSIITSEKDGTRYLADGQQRLSTLTLLLIFLHRCLKDAGIDNPALDPMIASTHYGQRTLNLDVPDRRECMLALLAGEDFDTSNATEAVQRLKENYEFIEQEFPAGEIGPTVVPYFADWLSEKVYLVEMAAASDEDAYTIFETVNDRGLSLTPTEMLKGHLLASISDEGQRIDAGKVWRERVEALKRIEGSKEEDAEAIKAWLRSQYAESIRERRPGAKPQDFDRLGTEFHRWVREGAEELLGLRTSSDYATFIRREFAFYARWYEELRKASVESRPGLEAIFANARRYFTLQFPLMLAPLVPGETEDVSRRKVRLVATFVDILLARRIWAGRGIDYSRLVYAMFLVMRDIRRQPVGAVAEVLRQRLDGTFEADKDTFEAVDPFGSATFRLTPSNRRPMHLLLAQLTDWVMQRSGYPSNLPDYLKRKGRGAFEIEHIWADKFERHSDEFANPSEFQEHRNRIGGLLLLPKTFNASFGALPFEDKAQHYAAQNMLARALTASAYSNNPGFLALNAELGAVFRSYPTFKKADLDDRQEAVRKLAKKVWSMERLTEVG